MTRIHEDWEIAVDFEQLAEGQWFEGIAVDGDNVWYSDVFAGGIRRYPPRGTDTVWRENDRWIGALMMNGDGKVLSGGATGIEWFDPASGALGMLIDSIDGKAIPGVNEMVADASGALYFGTVDSAAFERGEPPGPSALYRLDCAGKLNRLTGDLKFSNGLALSPYGKHLYHCESWVGVFSYDVGRNGQLGEPRLVIEKEDCDGLKVDVDGRLWIAGFKSPELLIVSPDGNVCGNYTLPGKAATNHHFGGSDGRDIYISTVLPVAVDDPSGVEVPAEMKSGLWRGRTAVAGLKLHAPQFKLG